MIELTKSDLSLPIINLYHKLYAELNRVNHHGGIIECYYGNDIFILQNTNLGVNVSINGYSFSTMIDHSASLQDSFNGLDG